MRAIGDAQIQGVWIVLLGTDDLALHALEECLLAVLGRRSQVDGVPALALVVVERQRPGHGFTVAGAVGHRDHGPVETDHNGGDGVVERRQRVLPGLFLGRGDAAHPVGNVLNVGDRHRATVILRQVALHRAHVELGILVAELAGEARRRAAHNARLMLQRTVDAPTARALVDVALDLQRTIRALVLLGVALARGQFGLPDANRTAIGVEAHQRRFGRATPHRVGRFQDGVLHLQQAAAQAHRHLHRHFVTGTPHHLSHDHQPSRLIRRL